MNYYLKITFTTGTIYEIVLNSLAAALGEMSRIECLIDPEEIKTIQLITI